jgi:hypothetical protein
LAERFFRTGQTVKVEAAKSPTNANNQTAQFGKKKNIRQVTEISAVQT